MPEKARTPIDFGSPTRVTLDFIAKRPLVNEKATELEVKYALKSELLLYVSVIDVRIVLKYLRGGKINNEITHQ